MRYLSSSFPSSSSSSKTLALLQTLTLRSPNPRFPHAPFSSSSAAADGQDTTDPATPSRPLRGGRDADLAATICHMMARRPWTTRLQNSIRNLIPIFPQPLVLSVLRGSSSSPDGALRFFRWVEKTGFLHDPETYREIVSLLSRNAMLNHARCILLEDMPKRAVGPEESMFAALIDGYGRAGIPQEAVKIFQKMPELGVDRTVVSYNALFKAILRKGRVLMAKRVFNAMIRDGVSPDLPIYNTLIWGFSLSTRMETAKRFFHDMKKKRGLTPDLVSYNNMINGWVRKRKVENAQKVFDEMGSVGLVPNEVSYNLLMKGYMSAGRMDDGLRLFGEMRAKEVRPTERTYAALMPWLCDLPERAVDAKKVFDEMAERRITPKDKNKSVFVRLISSMFGSGDLDGAMEVHKAMDRFRVPLDSAHYGVLMEGLCSGGRQEKAVEILDEFLEKGVLAGLHSAALEAPAYNPMIEYLCGNGQTGKAETFFRQLMKRGVDDKIAFNHLIRGHAREGKPESAFELLTIMTRRGVESDADAYVLLVESFLKKGEQAEARTVLDSMMEQGHLPSSGLFRSVMVALLDDGRVQTASRVMRSMIEKGVLENMDVVYKILEGLLMRGHVEEALGRINLMLENDCAIEFDRLMVALCDSEKVIPALKLVDFALERDCDMSFSSYDRLLETLQDAGKTLPAYSILCKLKAKGGVINKKGCEEVIRSLNAQGNTKQADILSRMLSGSAPPDAKHAFKWD